MAKGSWNPGLDADKLRLMLRNMLTLRAFDDRMFRAQRQGKTSFYMKSFGEEATSVARRWRAARRHVFPQLSPARHSDNKKLSAHRNDEPDLFEPRRPFEGPPTAHHVLSPGLWFFQRVGKPDHAISAGRGMGDGVGIAKRYAHLGGVVRRRFDCQGDFHSALTFAAVYNAPVIFQVVNNQWAISRLFRDLPGSERTTFAARAIGYGIAGLRVDGNRCVGGLCSDAVGGGPCTDNNGPTLIEYFTYRGEDIRPLMIRALTAQPRKYAEWAAWRPRRSAGQAHLIALG